MNLFGKNKIETPPALPKRQEKSQAELRQELERRFLALKPQLDNGIKEYQEALNNETFTDQEGEEPGTGEKRKQAMQTSLKVLIGKAEKMKKLLDSKQDLPQFTSEISVNYKQENITLDFEQKLDQFLAFYQKHQINLPPDFADTSRDIWQNNLDAIEQAIKENGFDELLIIPATPDLTDLHDKMTKGYVATYQGDNFKAGGSFAQAQSQNIDKPHLVLVHKAQELTDRTDLASTLNIKGQDVKLDQTLTLEDYLIWQRKYFDETGKHLDEKRWTWLATMSDSRLVRAGWDPSNDRLDVIAIALDFQYSALGARPSRGFF